MKAIWLGCVLGLASLGANAEAVLSCEEIDELGETLTGLGILIDDENAPIGEGTEADEALRDVVLGLADIAEAEDDADLADASLAMSEGWRDMDRERFADGLAAAVGKLAAISGGECP